PENGSGEGFLGARGKPTPARAEECRAGRAHAPVSRLARDARSGGRANFSRSSRVGRRCAETPHLDLSPRAGRRDPSVLALRQILGVTSLLGGASERASRAGLLTGARALPA